MKDSVLITGAGTGFGLETALRLAASGLTTYAAILDDSQRDHVAEQARQRRVEVRIVRLDVTDQATIQAAMETVVAECGGIFGLVNNAGLGLRGYFEDLDEEEIRRVFDVNLFGAMAVTRAALPHMRRARRGRLVFISSVVGRIGAMARTGYGASKFGLEGFAESLMQEVTPFGIRVSIVEPGAVNTERWTVNTGTSRRATDAASPYFAWFRAVEHESARLLRTSPVTAIDVAETVQRALTEPRPRLRYTVGRRAGLVIGLRAHVPGALFDRLYFGEAMRRVSGYGGPRLAGVTGLARRARRLAGTRAMPEDQGAASVDGDSPRSVLITGASTGFGLETALYLAARGFQVYATMRDLARRGALDAAAAQRGVTLRVLRLDVTDQASIDAAIGTIVEETGGIYGVVNNAGQYVRGFFEDLLDEEIRAIFEANVFGIMAVTRAVLPHMRRAGRGRIIMISSIAGRIGGPTTCAYSASRFAEEGFGECLSQEVVPLGIHVSLVAPGISKTEAWTPTRGSGVHARDPQGAYYAWYLKMEQTWAQLLDTAPVKKTDVAATIYRALTAPQPRLRYTVGYRPALITALRRAVPSELFARYYFGEVMRRITGTRPQI